MKKILEWIVIVAAIAGLIWFIVAFGWPQIKSAAQRLGLLPPDQGAVRGTVYDKKSGKGIEGSRIGAERISLPTASRTTVSDPQGDFQLEDVVVGDYSLTCAKEGYELAAYPVRVEPNRTTPRDCPIDRAEAQLPPSETPIAGAELPASPSRSKPPGVDITVTSANVATLPGTGRNLLVATITVTNSSQEPLYVDLQKSAFLGTVRGTECAVTFDFDRGLTALLPGKLTGPSVKVAPGKTVTGSVAYSIPGQAQLPEDLTRVIPGFVLSKPASPWLPPAPYSKEIVIEPNCKKPVPFPIR